MANLGKYWWPDCSPSLMVRGIFRRMPYFRLVNYYNLPRYVGFPSEMMFTKRYDNMNRLLYERSMIKARGPTLWLFNSSPWFFDGPNRNRWFTVLKHGGSFQFANCECHNQRVSLHFPMVFLWFSYGFPIETWDLAGMTGPKRWTRKDGGDEALPYLRFT